MDSKSILGNKTLQDGVRLPVLIVTAILFVGIVVLSSAIPVLILKTGGHGESIGEVKRVESPPIAGDVKLQPYPAADISAFTARKEQLLQSYGWVDRKHGLVRIPIDQAMLLLAARRSKEASP